MVVDRSGTNRLPWSSLARVSPNVQVAGGVAAIMGAAAVMWSYRRTVGTFLCLGHISELFLAVLAVARRGCHCPHWAIPVPSAQIEHAGAVSRKRQQRACVLFLYVFLVPCSGQLACRLFSMMVESLSCNQLTRVRIGAVRTCACRYMGHLCALCKPPRVCLHSLGRVRCRSQRSLPLLFLLQLQRRAPSMTSGGRHVPRWTCLRSALLGSRWRSTLSVMRESRSCERHRTCFFRRMDGVGRSALHRAATVLRVGQGRGGGSSVCQWSMLGPGRCLCVDRCVSRGGAAQ